MVEDLYHVSHLDRVMTTVVPKLSKSDAVPLKALQSARAKENASASFARALKDADASKVGVQQASEVADNSARLRGQTEELGASAGSPETGDDSVVNGNAPARPGDRESATKKPGDSGEAPAAESANVAGIALPLAGIVGTLTAPDAMTSADDPLKSEATNVLAFGATAKALELAQAATLWVNGGLKDGSAEAASVESNPSPSSNVLSTSQGSTISGVMDPGMFAAPDTGAGSSAPVETATGGAAGSFTSATMSSGLAGSPIGLSGASAALQGAGQGAGQSAVTNALLNAGRSEASLLGVGATGPRATSISNPGAVIVASALAAASSVRSMQFSAPSDSAELSATAGSITGTLSVSVMSGSSGADLGGSTLGSQTGGAGGESGASSGGSLSSRSNAFTVQATNPSEPNGMTTLSGAADTSGRLSRSSGLGSSYANSNASATAIATATASVTTHAASPMDVAANQPPTLEVNVLSAQASGAADPRAAWRDLRSKWDQPIRANSPKG